MACIHYTATVKVPVAAYVLLYRLKPLTDLDYAVPILSLRRECILGSFDGEEELSRIGPKD